MDNLVFDLERVTMDNQYFRRVIYTDNNIQIVLMSIRPNHEIGMEVHNYSTQFIRVENGEGIAELGNTRYDLYDGVSVTVPPGTYHNIINQSEVDMKLYVIYSPPLHEEGEILDN